MVNIVAFGASYSKNSINKQLANYVANKFENTHIEILDLNDYPVPLFTVDQQLETGIPEGAQRFLNKITEADLLIISMSEHNGSYTAAFKSLFDWVSLIKMKCFDGKKIFLLSTSPGPRGGLNSLTAAKERFPFHGGTIISDFSLPSFLKNFDSEKGIIPTEYSDTLNEKIDIVKKELDL